MLKMWWIAIGIGLSFATLADAKTSRSTKKKSVPAKKEVARKALSRNSRPAKLKPESLMEFAKLPTDRQRLITESLSLCDRDLRYRMGASDPNSGGIDCSGSMGYVLDKVGISAPRTAEQQYAWLRDNRRLHGIPTNTKSLEDKCFSVLKPGDLVFWSGTYAKNGITHVAMYLGHEFDGRPVMVNATHGRSYRGVKASGYGVYDFRLPQSSGSRMVGFGTPVGIKE